MTAMPHPDDEPAPWSVGAYRRPRLVLDRVEAAGDGGLRIRRGAIMADLAPDGIDADVLAALLARLTDPDDGGWRQIADDAARRARQRLAGGDPGPDGLVDLIECLDRLGLVAEADDGADSLTADRARIARAVDRAAGWLAAARRLSSVDDNAVDRLGADLLERTRHLVAGGVATGPFAPPLLASGRTGFHDAVLTALVDGWAVTAPASLIAAGRLLTRVVPAVAAMPGPLLPDGCLYDAAEVERHLGVLVTGLVLAGLPGAGRRALLPADIDLPLTGIGLIHAAEAATPSLVAAAGADRLGALLRGAAPDQALALARGIYLAQYHVSARITDIFLPAMRMGLRSGLRARMRRYHVEESGHEAHELAACIAVGLDAQAVPASLPLPPFTAYVELLGQIAERAPAAFLPALIVTEGLPGAPNPTNDWLAAAGIGEAADDTATAHQRVNAGLDHTTMPRRLGAEIPRIGIADARLALDLYALMIDLNARALGWIAAYHGDPSNPPLPDWLPVTPEVLAGWAADGMV
ncbi:hypothetical protein GCM10011505_00370 [Tistrella bauzanensis]|uniref:Uncharacterized protein n=1 Tax=Tistrella bauzanensis TaxID=657419 RepID=A0ABQ1I6Z1_9PROT|nr:hypothetical protein [Tistrella bauzanensis]GGB23063.1 hypothetical protein GCM10011505_00370 [Tistrella bauzanensis]